MNNAVLYIPENTGAQTVDFICSSFRKRLGSGLEFEVVENKELLGGFIAKINGKTYDNSVSSRLSRMRSHLLEK